MTEETPQNRSIQNISILGAGSWGTALAEVLSRAGRKVTLYAREAALAEALNAEHENITYLPGAKLDPAIHATADAGEAVKDAELVLLVTPAQYLRALLEKFAPLLPQSVPLVNAAKGIELETGSLLSEVAVQAAPGHPFAVLSGPSFASETVKGLPTAVTLATTAPAQVAEVWAQSLRGPAFRPYLSDDPLGAEIAGALKNVIAIACGIVEGRKLGQNAKAAVMTRGIAEIRRLGVQKGAQSETFLGLSGIGDLTLTCNSLTSRNFALGHALGQGQSLQDYMAGRRTVAEGVATAAAAKTFAAREGVEMPISEAVCGILHEGADVGAVIEALLARDLRHETQ
ncbi:MAG: NAD(P)H-dependent glycerol-3-phosphate dehydrogenase [Alphaproteobacteria bacterium]|nr:NAD(P)H-dependent glycerol-3-phosphate dehydrogenase [Alphaproteobacteria bacterium]